MNKKIAFVSGASGQTASYMIEKLLKEGFRVVGLKRRTSLISTDRIDHLYGQQDFSLRYFDLNDPASIYSLLKEYQPDFFFNFAAMSHVKVSFEVTQDTVNNVGLGVLRILDAIKLVSPHTKFFQASSSEQFGGNKIIPFNEESKFVPNSPYAAAKVLACDLVRIYRESYGLYACSGIMFNSESPRRGSTFVTRKITLGAASIKLGIEDNLVLGNLFSKRDWTFSGDTVEAIFLMMQQETPSDYVISSDETHTVEDFLKVVFEHSGLGDYKKYVLTDKKYFRPLEVDCLLGDSTKIRKLGWKPKVSFEELAKMMYDSDFKLMELKIKEGKSKWRI
ncbi:MAG: GDP-mannose 4,6-dehydratase [Nanoarchaeota archaeon]|nr:GDP-mannose 4,6-dehydratase [Nanoarchaeota archaeon]